MTPLPPLERAMLYQNIFLHNFRQQRLFRIDIWSKYPKLIRAVPVHVDPKQFHLQISILATLMRLGWKTVDLDTILLPSAYFQQGKPWIPNKDNEWFTWGDFIQFMPNPLFLIPTFLTGKVLQEIISFSRQTSKLQTNQSSPQNNSQKNSISFLHTCSNVHYRQEFGTWTDTIETIVGEPFDPKKEYLVAVPCDWMELDFPIVSEHEESKVWQLNWQKSMKGNKETAQSSHLLLLQSISRIIWFQSGAILDLHVHETLSKEHVLKSLQRKIGNGQVLSHTQDHVAQFMVEHIWNMVLTDSGDRKEGIRMADMLLMDPMVLDASLPGSNMEQDFILRTCVADYLGLTETSESVKKVVNSIRRPTNVNPNLEEKIQSRYDSMMQGNPQVRSLAQRRAAANLTKKKPSQVRKLFSRPPQQQLDLEMVELQEPLVRVRRNAKANIV